MVDDQAFHVLMCVHETGVLEDDITRRTVASASHGINNRKR
jgi:hypothetical protein